MTTKRQDPFGWAAMVEDLTEWAGPGPYMLTGDVYVNPDAPTDLAEASCIWGHKMTADRCSLGDQHSLAPEYGSTAFDVCYDGYHLATYGASRSKGGMKLWAS